MSDATYRAEVKVHRNFLLLAALLLQTTEEVRGILGSLLLDRRRIRNRLVAHRRRHDEKAPLAIAAFCRSATWDHVTGYPAFPGASGASVLAGGRLALVSTSTNQYWP